MGECGGKQKEQLVVKVRALWLKVEMALSARRILAAMQLYALCAASEYTSSAVVSGRLQDVRCAVCVAIHIVLTRTE